MFRDKETSLRIKQIHPFDSRRK